MTTSLTGQVTDRSPDASHWNARLWDYDVSGTAPKLYHLQWLTRVILNVNRHPSFMWYISATGSASLTGITRNDSNNRRLAGDRVRIVSEMLQKELKGYGLVFNPTFNAGTLLSQFAHHPIGVENDEDRCVYVAISTESVPPPPPHVPTSIPLSKKFAIRYSSGGNFGPMKIGVDSALFDIADLDNHIHSYYEYSAATIGVSPDLIPASITMAGDWTDFETTTPANVADFDGPCRYTTGGALSFSINKLTLTPAAGISIVGGTLDIDTGTTFGAGVSTSIPGTAWMKLKSRRPFPYSGTYPP